jgi:SAM-dependent methyltransferase
VKPLGSKLTQVRWRCVACGGEDFTSDDAGLACKACGSTLPVRDGRVIVDEPPSEVAQDRLDRIKHGLKGFRRLYALLTYLISPLYFDGTRRRFIADRVLGRKGVFLHLGSGNTDLAPEVINIDAVPYDNADMVCDIGRLPLATGSVDGVLTISVLEHLPDPEQVLGEIQRVLRPGGWVYTDVPFVVGFHASPDDFKRWTYEGIKLLHDGFEIERIVINGGPTSALLWIFQEWVSILLSFGSRRLHTLIYLAVMCLTFPVKFLDIFLKHSPLARNISSCFILVGRKPTEDQ